MYTVQMSDEALRVLSRNVRRMIEDRGWTQADLAEKSGVSLRAVSYLCMGQRYVRMDAFHRIADALGVQPCDLLVDQSKTAYKDDFLARFDAASPATQAYILEILNREPR